jgi:hypothetical protein
MKIKRITLKVGTAGGINVGIKWVELPGEQGALIPQVGDTYLTPGYSMTVTGRIFEFQKDTLSVVLVP